jgi:glyceraldehyde 3-phosphate dehydrogenase
MRRAIRVAVNGFGRIGRSVVRAAMQKKMWARLEIVAVNDVAPLDLCAYLFQYDSVFGRYPGRVEAGEGALEIDGCRIRFTSCEHVESLDFGDADLVLECTGNTTTRAAATRLLDAGAGKVLVSGPCAGADFTLVIGANEERLAASHRIVSNASCTTNALAPLTRLLDNVFGIVTGHMTTVHCYTGSQPTIDSPRGHPARSRAAALSIVPTSTSASRLIDLVLPHLSGRLNGAAVRVPVASVSSVDLSVMPEANVTVDEVNSLFRAAAQGPRADIHGFVDAPLVSSDLRQMPQSIIMAGRETSVTRDGMLRVFGWYDNEWGFSNRLIDAAQLMTSVDAWPPRSFAPESKIDRNVAKTR